MRKEVADAFAIDCYGYDGNLEESVAASVTVFLDGSRQVGCPYVFLSGGCLIDDAPENKVSETNKKTAGNNMIEDGINMGCVHLNPASSGVEIE